MKTSVILAAGLSSYLFLGNTSAQALSLSFEPLASSNPNQAMVGIRVSGLGDNMAPSLSGFDLDVAFDPTILDFQQATFGDPVLGDQLFLNSPDDCKSVSLCEAVDNSTSVNLFEVSDQLPATLDSLQKGSFILASLTFNILQNGNSPLTLSINDFLDASSQPQDLVPDLIDGSIQVPEPSMGLGLLIGMGVFGVLTSVSKFKIMKSD